MESGGENFKLRATGGQPDLKAKGEQDENRLFIRPFAQYDLAELYGIFSEINAGGDFFPYPADTSFEQFEKIWQPDDSFSFVAICNEQIVGAYYVKPTWPGRAAHVGTATYMVAKKARGLGVGLALGEHSLEAARARGFAAMQFNLVVSTNEPAVALWKKIGFTVVGTIPKGFDHAVLGKVDTYIMHRPLQAKNSQS